MGRKGAKNKTEQSRGAGSAGVDLYAILGVDKIASKEEIKKAFRKLAMRHHPDAGGDAEQFKKLHRAYTVLSNDEKRSRYDATGEIDDDKVDNSETDLLSYMTALLNTVVGQLLMTNPEDVKVIDIIEAMTIAAGRTIEDGKRLLLVLAKRKKACEEVRDRISIEGEENCLSSAMTTQIEGYEQQICMQERQLDTVTKVQIEIKKYKYRVDPARRDTFYYPGKDKRYSELDKMFEEMIGGKKP